MKRKTKASFFILLFLVVCVFIVYRRFAPVSQPVSGAVELDLEELVIPTGAEGQIISHTGYTLCYSEEHEQPWWVAYVLTPQETIISVGERKDNFREDPFVLSGSASLADYKGSGYDRGHLVPYADLSWSEESGSESFFLSNMSPQVAQLNRGRWEELESTVRTFSLDGPVCVVTGPVLSDGPFESIGENHVSVPHYFFKVILDYYGDEVKALAFVLPNAVCPESLEYYAVTVDYVEDLTGLDFFSLLDDSIEASLESSIDLSLWDFSKYSKKKAQAYGWDPDTLTFN